MFHGIVKLLKSPFDTRIVGGTRLHGDLLAIFSDSQAAAASDVLHKVGLNQRISQLVS